MKNNCFKNLVSYCKRTRLLGEFDTLTKGMLCNMYDALSDSKRAFHSFIILHDEVHLFDYDIIVDRVLLKSLSGINDYLEEIRKEKKIKPKEAEYWYECGVSGDELLVMVDNNVGADKRYISIPILSRRSTYMISLIGILERSQMVLNTNKTSVIYDISKEAFELLRDSYTLNYFDVKIDDDTISIPLCKSFIFGLRSYPKSMELSVTTTNIKHIFQVSVRIVKDDIEEVHSCFISK